jgi:hypothetical protein
VPISSAVQAQIAGRLVRRDFMIEMQFASGTIRVWNGDYPLTTTDAKVWEPARGAARISGLQQILQGDAPEIEITLSGVDSRFAAKARGARSEYYDRPAVIFMQCFDEAWQPLDAPLARAWRVMRSIVTRDSAVEAGVISDIGLILETPLVSKRRPPFGYWTHQDQQGRFPGDEGLRHVGRLDNKLVKFPQF